MARELSTSNRQSGARGIGRLGAPDDDQLAEGARAFLLRNRGAAPGIEGRALFLPDRTFALHASVSRSRIRDVRWASLRVKDGLVDAQRELFGRRASIARKNPDLPLRLRIDQDRATLLLDSSGDPLDRRGYRLSSGPAPVREQLAAACVLASGWKGSGPVVDPMCGTGTLLVEAAWIALGWAPGRLRDHWAFERFPSFDRSLFLRLRGSEETPDSTSLKLLGNDISEEAVTAANRNLGRAGVKDYARLVRGDASELRPPEGAPGLLVVNPPYGDRMDRARDSEQVLGALLSRRFTGWKAVVLAGDSRRGRGLRLRPEHSIPVRNGPIEARILVFDLKKR